MGIPTLLITGPSGVGKTTAAIELSLLLQSLGVAHALIDTGELGPHLSPTERRSAEGETDWTEPELRLVEPPGGRRSRLILAGVMESLTDDVRWVQAGVPDAEITAVRLRAAPAELHERLTRREVGSGLDYHVRRSDEVAARTDGEDRQDRIVVETAGRSATDVASEILSYWRWQPEAGHL